MRYMFGLLVGIVLSLSCSGRVDEDVGAAPDRGDTTAVTAVDTASAPLDTTMGHAPDHDTTSMGY